MPVWIRTLVITVLLVGTVTGWAATIFLGTQVLPNIQLDDADLEEIAANYVSTYALVQKEAAGYERLAPFLAGSALEAMQREANAAAQPVGSLTLATGDFETIWRAADQAMISARFTLESTSGSQEIGEHYLMQLVDGRWRIIERWRIEIDPGTPIVAGDEDPSPSETPAASESATPSAEAAPSEGAAGEAPAASEEPAP